MALASGHPGDSPNVRPVERNVMARPNAMKHPGQSQSGVKTRVPRATDFFVAARQNAALEC